MSNENLRDATKETLQKERVARIKSGQAAQDIARAAAEDLTAVIPDKPGHK